MDCDEIENEIEMNCAIVKFDEGSDDPSAFEIIFLSELKKEVSHFELKEFKAFFEIGGTPSSRWAICKVCNAFIESDADFTLVEHIASHTLRHIDEVREFLKSLEKLLEVDER